MHGSEVWRVPARVVAAAGVESATDLQSRLSGIRLTRRALLVAVSLSITTAMWVAGHFDELGSAGLWPWRGPSQLIMLWSATLASLAILSVVRA
jgi:hypothetical protein